MPPESLELNQENFDLVARNVNAAQELIRVNAERSASEIAEAKVHAEGLVAEAMKASQEIGRANRLSELANDSAGESKDLYRRAMTDGAPYARMLKGERLTPTESKIVRYQEMRDTILCGAQALGLKIDAENPAQSEVILRSSMAKSETGRKLLAEYEQLHKEMTRTAGGLGDTVTEYVALVPTAYSPQIQDRYTLGLKVAALFPTFDMPTPVFKVPVMYARDAITYSKPGQQTAQADITLAPPWYVGVAGTVLQATLTAIKSHKFTPFSQESTWDSIAPIVPMILADHADFHAWTQEMAIVNGDDTGTHMDSDNAATYGATTSFGTAYKGIRYVLGHATTLAAADLSASASGALSVNTNWLLIRNRLGKYGVNPLDLAYIISPGAYMQLLAATDVVTVDKYGPNATVLTGELAKYYGVPVIVSEAWPDDTSATGYVAGTTSYRSICIVNRKMWYVGTRGGFESKYADLDVLYGVQAIGSWKRSAFTPALTASTANSIGYSAIKMSKTT